MIGLIAAVDPNWVIGVNGTMPWHYKADFKRFKVRTMGSTLIMGKATWESLPKPLPGRRAFVLTRNSAPTSKHPLDACKFYQDLPTAVRDAIGDSKMDDPSSPDIWFAGGAQIYEWALLHCAELDTVDLTFVPSSAEANGLLANPQITYFPHQALDGWVVDQEEVNGEDPRLTHRIYKRR
jgi:dihydrofolate reductase